jgi:hypothetical protein
MKETLVTHFDLVPHVLFRVQFEKAGVGYQDVWRWIVMVVLPIVSLKWRNRVDAGPLAKLVQSDFWDCVTTGDMAFVFTLIKWGGGKWLVGDEMEKHQKNVTKMNKTLDAPYIKKEFGWTAEDVGATAELDSDVRIHDQVVELKVDVGADVKSDELSDDDDSDEDDDDDENAVVTGKGRKKGVEGFGSFQNIGVFNENGKMLESVLDSKQMERVVESWTTQAMKWVNKEVIDVDSGGDDDDSEGGSKSRKRQINAPFVPRDRSKKERLS